MSRASGSDRAGRDLRGSSGQGVVDDDVFFVHAEREQRVPLHRWVRSCSLVETRGQPTFSPLTDIVHFIEWVIRAWR